MKKMRNIESVNCFDCQYLKLLTILVKDIRGLFGYTHSSDVGPRIF